MNLHKSLYIAFCVFFVFLKAFVFGESYVDGNSTSVGVYSSIVAKTTADIYANTQGNIYGDVYGDIYVNNYGKYLKLVTEKGVNAQANFVKYFSDWQWSGQEQDFFSYAESRAERESQMALCYNKAIAKFGIGTALIATTWIVSFVVPGGQIFTLSTIVIAESTTAGALSGAAIGAVSSAGFAYLQGKSGDDLLCETINGAANGYLVGAITGLVSGGAKAYKLAKSAKTIDKVSELKNISNSKVYDFKGKYLGKYIGEKWEFNGQKIYKAKDVLKAGDINSNGFKYDMFLADDGNGNFFKVLNPDFSDVKIVDKIYKAPKKMWKNSNATKGWCQQQYLKDLANPNVEKILGISKQEAAMRLQFEKGLDLRDIAFRKANSLSEKQVNEFLKRYSKGAWHHLPSSGDLIYVPANHYQLAPHTGGDSFWGSKLTAESIEW